MDRKASFTAASTAFPVKTVRDKELVQSLAAGRGVLLRHPQLIPTNRCNLKCEWCSCSREDRGEELSLADLREIIPSLSRLGAQACTITGGGEPLLHPHIAEIVEELRSFGIQVGLVTNGTQFAGKARVLDSLTWCRVSLGDRKAFALVKWGLDRCLEEFPKVDWSLSYVVTPRRDRPNVDSVVRFVQEHPNLVHIRWVSDILQGGTYFVDFRKWLEEQYPFVLQDDRHLFQDRSLPVAGGRCWLCWLKPVIGADRQIYACCGSQYAFGEGSEESRRMSRRLSLGDAKYLEEIWRRGAKKPFDGSICSVCYYGGYNATLEALQADVAHEKFQ